eukprot:scpid37030/ scgid28016/ 
MDADMPSWNDRMMEISLSGTPSLERTLHMAALGTESYALRKSMNTAKPFDECSCNFSATWRTENTMSEHPPTTAKTTLGVRQVFLSNQLQAIRYYSCHQLADHV